MAPEIMQGRRYDAKADLWSVGMILYECVVGKTPFRGRSQVSADIYIVLLYAI